MTEAQLAAALAREGFVFPWPTLRARTAARLGLPVACAVLMLETGGGRNEYGHDVYPGGVEAPGFGWGTVTEANYRAFLSLRAATGRSNGVGPCQLTSPGLQDEADAAGGCWLPQHNMAVGFRDLHDLVVERGSVEAGCAAYNGSGPAAEAYGRHAYVLAEHYRSIGLGTVVGVLTRETSISHVC